MLFKMLKKQKKILKLIAALFCLGLSSIFITHYLTPSLTSAYGDEKWFKQDLVTDDPLSKKRWQRLKLITDAVNELNISKTILLWTKFFGNADYVPKLSDMCPTPKCLVTSNRDYLNKSDAIIFHLRDLSLDDMPKSRRANQIWILLHHESPPHTPIGILDKLSGAFNWTATYRFDSEILLTPTVIKKQHPLVVDTKNYAKSKRKMIAWFVSNCKTPGNREFYVRELQKRIQVDIFGYCGTLTCLPKMSDECFAKVGNQYKFYLSFENSICKDYVTEKLFNILNTNMIPIVFGGANYSKVAPPSSYIDALSFKSPKDLANYLLYVASDDKLYNSFFEWRKSYEITGKHYACKICKKLQEPTSKPTFYVNISEWWFGEANCKSWPYK